MLDIIKVQLFRLKKSVLFWVMFAITAALPILATIITASTIGFIDNIAGSVGGEELGMDIWTMLHEQGLTLTLLNSLPQIGSNAALLSVITAAIVLSKEFNDGTTRNVLLANKTRAELYFAYLITAIFISAFFILGNFATTMIVAAPIFGFGEMTAGGVVTACLCSLALSIFAILFVESLMCMFLFAMRKQWAAILFPLLICMFVPSLLTIFVTLIITTMALKGQAVSVDAFRWVPFVGQSMYDCSHIDGAVVGMSILYMSIFTAMFVAIGYYVFRKSDLK